MTPEITTTVGPHKGWTTHTFTLFERPWKLLTIEGGHDAPHSNLKPEDNNARVWWAHYHIHQFPGILTPEAAIEIIRLAASAHDFGRRLGENAKALEIRQALGVRP